MSRIVGVYGSTSEADRHQSVERMLSACQRGTTIPEIVNRRTRRIFSHPRCTLGYWGESPHQETFEDDRFVIVSDGPILDLSFFGLPGTKDDMLRHLASILHAHGVAHIFSKIIHDNAVAIFDKREDAVYLVRDKIGIQPLYFAPLASGEAFASRIAGLLSLEGVSRTPRPRYVGVFGASHYRGIDNAPDESPLEGIYQVRAGHLRRIAREGATTSQYWSLSEKGYRQENEDILADEYKERLSLAIRRRLAASSNPAFTLSGGMDSSSVLALAVELQHTPQIAFSSAYTDLTYDEREEIQPMLTRHVATWHPILIDEPRLVHDVSAMIEQHDEPIATVTWFSHYRLIQEVARLGHRSLFGGLGGDELNAGEFEYFPCFFSDLRSRGEQARLDEEITRWAEYHQHPIYIKNAAVAEQMLRANFEPTRPEICRADRRRIERYKEILHPSYFNIASWHPTMEHPFSSALRNRTYQDIFFETAPCCLRAQDRQGEACGVRHMLPFFDSELVEFMFQVPEEMKIHHGVTKHLLRRAMRGVLPEETRTRVKKTGWNAPAHLWFTQRNNREDLLDLIRSKRFVERNIFIPDQVERLLTEHIRIVESDAATENHMMVLWQVLNTELWFRWLENFRTFPA